MEISLEERMDGEIKVMKEFIRFLVMGVAED